MEGRMRWFLGFARNSGGYSLPITGTPCEVPLPRKTSKNAMPVSWAQISGSHRPAHQKLFFFCPPFSGLIETPDIPNCLQIMDSLPTVLLKPGEADRIVAGHPWIYHGEILRLTTPLADGELVQVKDHRQRLLGVGFFNSKSKINVRLLAPERVEVDEAFFGERIRAALAVRQRHLPRATSFRVVNAESDFLSGLIVDKYEDVLVVQISSLGMDRRKMQIVAALQKIFSPRAILERGDIASRKFEGLAEASGVLFGPPSGSSGEQAKAWTPTLWI